jgi:hypothetical protein
MKGGYGPDGTINGVLEFYDPDPMI